MKDRAKNVLRRTYWLSFAVTAVMLVLAGLQTRYTYSADLSDWGFSGGSIWNWNWSSISQAWNVLRSVALSWPFISMVIGVGIVGVAISLVYRVFLLNVLEIGQSRYFTMSRYGASRFEEIIYGFRGGRYMDHVKTMFYPTLYLFLWSLIPLAGVVLYIVKSLSYSMVPYIAAENPNLPPDRVLEISKRMTDGEKGDMFVLQLSFIGWGILCMFTCGIGFFFLAPYIEATKAELYGALRYKAVKTGICSKDELGAELEI